MEMPLYWKLLILITLGIMIGVIIAYVWMRVEPYLVREVQNLTDVGCSDMKRNIQKQLNGIDADEIKELRAKLSKRTQSMK